VKQLLAALAFAALLVLPGSAQDKPKQQDRKPKLEKQSKKDWKKKQAEKENRKPRGKAEVKAGCKGASKSMSESFEFSLKIEVKIAAACKGKAEYAELAAYTEKIYASWQKDWAEFVAIEAEKALEEELWDDALADFALYLSDLVLIAEVLEAVAAELVYEWLVALEAIEDALQLYDDLCDEWDGEIGDDADLYDDYDICCAGKITNVSPTEKCSKKDYIQKKAHKQTRKPRGKAEVKSEAKKRAKAVGDNWNKSKASRDKCIEKCKSDKRFSETIEYYESVTKTFTETYAKLEVDDAAFDKLLEDDIEEILDELDEALDDMQEAADELEEMAGELEDLADDLEEAIEEAADDLEEALEEIEDELEEMDDACDEYDGEIGDDDDDCDDWDDDEEQDDDGEEDDADDDDSDDQDKR